MNRLILASCAALAACGNLPPVPKSPAQAMYEVTELYAVALAVAVTYDRLPLCPAGAPVCSTVTNKAAIKVAVDRAGPIVTVAQNIARATNADASLASNAIAAAMAAVQDISAITTTLRIK